MGELSGDDIGGRERGIPERGTHTESKTDPSEKRGDEHPEDKRPGLE
jgi:hypothetical protein